MVTVNDDFFEVGRITSGAAEICPPSILTYERSMRTGRTAFFILHKVSVYVLEAIAAAWELLFFLFNVNYRRGRGRWECGRCLYD